MPFIFHPPSLRPAQSTPIRQPVAARELRPSLPRSLNVSLISGTWKFSHRPTFQPACYGCSIVRSGQQYPHSVLLNPELFARVVNYTCFSLLSETNCSLSLVRREQTFRASFNSMANQLFKPFKVPSFLFLTTKHDKPKRNTGEFVHHRQHLQSFFFR